MVFQRYTEVYKVILKHHMGILMCTILLRIVYPLINDLHYIF